MAATLVTTGVPQEVGVRYTYITDVEADWASVPISTYFYDLETKLPYYKNADNEVLNIFASGGGDSIYTADGTLTEDRTVDLDGNKLTFKDGVVDLEISEPSTSSDNIASYPLVFKNTDSTNSNLVGMLFNDSSVNSRASIYTRFGTKNSLNFNVRNSSSLAEAFNYTDDALNVFNSLSADANGNESLTIEGQHSSGTIGSGARIGFKQTDSASYGAYIKSYTFGAGNTGLGFATGFGSNPTVKMTIDGNGKTTIGGTETVGTEDISLQGSTLITEKLELSTTTDGFLMPRLTTAQKIAIPTPDTHLMVFDTDLGTIERYDGFNWVTQSGTGALGISGASGDYTYYPNYNTAIAAASSGDTIEQFGNIVETGAVAVDITKNLTIQMNGYSYTLDNAGTDRAFTVTGISLTDIKILNGTINRINGTGGGALALGNNTTTKPTLSLEGTTLYCDLSGSQTLLYVLDSYTITGGLFKGAGDLYLGTGSTLTNFVYNGDGIVRADSGVMVSNGHIFSVFGGLMVYSGASASNVTVKSSGSNTAIINNGKLSNCKGYSVGSVGIYSSTSSDEYGVFNCYGYSDGSYGIQISSGVCYNSVGRSTGGNGIWTDLRNNPDIVNCVGWSSSDSGIYCDSSGTTGKFVNCYAESELDTTSGHAFEMEGGATKFINCTGKVTNSGAFGIKGSSATASIVNFSGIGMASLFDGVTNAQIETTDAYGNVLVV